MTDFLFRLLALVRKELMSVLKDPSSRVILFVPVLLQSLIFGYVATYDLSNVPYAVLDQSRSPTSANLLAHLDGTGFFRRVATLQSDSAIAPLIESQRALMVLRIGPRFEQQLLDGQSEPVQLILDARNSTTANSAAAAVAEVVDAFNLEQAQQRGGGAPALTLETRAWFNPNLETRWNFMPALIASLSMLQTLMLTALSVAREREQGTFDQLLVTPLSPGEIMIGKAIPPMMIGLVQSTLVLLMPMMLLSGLTTPVAAMPRVLQIATLVNPLRYGIDLVRRVYLEGVDLSAVIPDLVPLLLIAAVTLPAAAWLFRNRLV